VGVDPGPATGICFLDYDKGRLAGRTLLQCDAASAVIVLRGMLTAFYADGRVLRRTASVEQFRTGTSAGSAGKGAQVTRQLVMEIAEMLQLFHYTVRIRPAADVKPWASDKRLTAAGAVTGAMHGDMNHAYDAARHAIFEARSSGVIRDPLLRKP
jgi:hypothetical protein